MADISPKFKDPLISIQTSPILHSSSDSSDCEYIPHSINRKLTYAFGYIQAYYDLDGLIQFWEAVNINGRCLLTTCDQPFIAGYINYKKYRSCCEKYKYNIEADVEEEDPTIITTGAATTAFRNQLPEYLFLERVDRMMSPLESSALECGLKYSFMFPVFYPPSQSGCVGVVEYSIKPCYYFPIELIDVLEDVGFKMFNAEELLRYKSIHDLQHAKDEIDDILRIISEVLHLDLSQVWIAYEEEYLSASLQDTLSKRMLWLKLTDSCFDDDMDVYRNACYRFPMKMDQVFAGKTLQNYEPLFIRDITKLKNNEPQRLLTPYCVECSCFMICLRSTKTGELDYVFEFFWRETQHNDYIIELLLVSLKRHLPSFKFSSGAELDDELRIVDVDNSTESETKYIKIFQPNQLSLISVTPKRGRRPEDEECLAPSKAKCKTAKKEISLEQIKSQFGKTQKEAAKNLNSNDNLLLSNYSWFLHDWNPEFGL